MVGQADNENDTNNHDDQFFAINEFPAECITKEAERELPDDITDVCCCVDGATEEEWVVWRLLALQASPVSVKLTCIQL